MATFTFYSAGFPTGVDMTASTVKGLFDYDYSSFTASAIRLFDNTSTYSLFNGTGFTYVKQGGEVVDITAGTLTSLVAKEAGTTVATVTGWTLSAATFADYAFANNYAAVLNYMLSGNDRIIGTAAVDGLVGKNGNDLIEGKAGSDFIQGGAGNDSLQGDSGNDGIYGGVGADAFVFDAALNPFTNVDRIFDFRSVDDVFRLDDAVFAGIGVRGALGAARYRVGTEALDASDRIIYDKAAGKLYFDPDGAGGDLKQLLFAQVNPGQTILAEDFLVY